MSEEVVADFCNKYPLDKAAISPEYRKLDITKVIIYQLESLGISGYEYIGECTICSQVDQLSDETGGQSSSKYFSYRRDGSKDVQVSAIMIS